MSGAQVTGWPVVLVGAELLRRDPAPLLAWLDQRDDRFSLVVDGTGPGAPPEFRRDPRWAGALSRCARVAICVGRSASLGIVWHHRLRGLGDVQRRLFLDFGRATAWAREPHEAARPCVTWISFAPPLRPSVI